MFCNQFFSYQMIYYNNGVYIWFFNINNNYNRYMDYSNYEEKT